MEQGFAIVVDIGKTLSKLTLWSKNGHCLQRISRPNATTPALPEALPYASLDLDGISAWLFDALGEFAGHPVEAIIPVAHGAGIAGIRDDALAFTPPDYEWELPAPALAEYRAGRDAFALTGSPALPAGLNLGSQLHYLDTLAPDWFGTLTLLPWAQYWAWMLCGVAVSEVTSLGCHSDLWSPAAGDFSLMAKRRGWAAQFAPLVGAGEAIGTLRSEIAECTGLSPEVRIYAGLHDSNAALLAARGFPEIAGQDATVLSTGTWFVAMRSGSGPAELADLPEARDCLINVDVAGKPVPSARFMGGRELELLGERIDRPGTAGLAEVLASGAMLLPSQASGSGPFPESAGSWTREPTDPAQRSAAATLYAALMADVSLELIGTQGTLLIEGRFAASEIFTRALANLHPEWRVLAIAGDADVSFGALRLMVPGLAPHAALTPIKPLDADINAYRALWRREIEMRESRNG